MNPNNKNTLKPVNVRIRIIIDKYCEGKQKKLSKLINVSEQTISSALKRDSDPSFNVLSGIISAFEYINPTWLMTGIGEIEKEKLDETSSIKTTDSNEHLVKRFEEIICELKDVKNEIAIKDKKIKKLTQEINSLNQK